MGRWPPPVRSQPAHRVVETRERPTIDFVTVCTRGRRPLLANDDGRDRLIELWTNATAWLVGRYLLMPDHVHVLVAPGAPSLPLTNWIAFWKRADTRRRGESVWQDGYWDTTMRSLAHLRETWHYIEQNPVRRGLVAASNDWPHQGELNVLPWR